MKCVWTLWDDVHLRTRVPVCDARVRFLKLAGAGGSLTRGPGGWGGVLGED